MSYFETLSFKAPFRQSPTMGALELIGSALTRMAESCRMLVTAYRGRRALATIADLTPAGLRDIGLLPGDLPHARYQAYSVDPTEVLARCAADRRRPASRG